MRRLLALVVLTWLVLAGCASVPTGSDPVAVQTVGGDSPGQAQPAPPVKDLDPDLLVCAFVTASTSPTDRHAAARQYLTRGARDGWDDAASTVVVTNLSCLNNDRAGTPADRSSILLRGQATGTLSSTGVFTVSPAPTEYQASLDLVRVDGQWRIDELPQGVVMRVDEFESAYRLSTVYFLDPTLTYLVPDPRWVVRDSDSLAARLVDLLIAGPGPDLALAVTNQLQSTSLRSNVSRADDTGTADARFGRGVRVPFGNLGRLDPAKRSLIAAQVVWTLDAAGVLGPYFLLADDSPLVDTHPDGWTTADVIAFNPVASPGAEVGLHAVLRGALVQVPDDGRIEPVTGALGRYTSLRSAALSPDGRRVAGVAAVPGGTELVVGQVDGPVVAAARGNTMTRPTWTPDGASIWVVQNGRTVLRMGQDTRSGVVTTEQVDISALGASPGAITALRLSRDGVRAALVVAGQVVVAAVTRTDAGTASLIKPQKVAPDLGAVATTLDWTQRDTLIVARNEGERPVVTVTIDGSGLRELTGTNLSVPVREVVGSPTRSQQYVADNRGVLELSPGDISSQPIWRQVDGLGGEAGPDALPILPG